METQTIIIITVIALLLGGVVGYYIRQSIARKRAGTIEAELSKKIAQTKQTAEEMIAKAKQKAEEIEKKSFKDLEERQKIVIKAENRLFKREEEIEEKQKEVTALEKEANERIEKLKEIKTEIEEKRAEIITKLEKIAGLSRQQAKEELLERTEKEYEAEVLERIRKLEEKGVEQYEKKAKGIIASAVQTYALSQATEIMTSTVVLPTEEIKGRIIGKEGRNIRAFEKAAGVELIVDETPGMVIISSFNPIRREIAKITLEKLLRDGRIQPARIEQEIEKAPEKLIHLLGRLQYRTSYGQNVLSHSLEVAHLSSAIASEIGLNAALAKKAGLLHDIGKALDYKIEGSHTDIGGKILEKFNIDPAIISAVKSQRISL